MAIQLHPPREERYIEGYGVVWTGGPPAPDHAPSRCPVCGRADCPDPPRPRVEASQVLLVVILGLLPVAFGALAWWLGVEGWEALQRGAWRVWP